MMFPAPSFSGKRVAIFGLARSGMACAEALRDGGADLIAWDDSEASVAKARSEGFHTADLRQENFSNFSALVLSPGVPLTHPEPHWTVAKARAAGIEIIGDTEIFQREIAGTGAKTVMITGTNGKSTTTALTGHLFTAAGRDCEIGGNIGKAVFLLKPPVKDRIYVIELSSFQLDLMASVRPDAGILTNITPDHLDRHGNMEHYVETKGRLFCNQGPGDTAIVGVDDRWGVEIAAKIKTGARVIEVAVQRGLCIGISAPGGVLREMRDGSEVASLDLRDLPALKGAHNWQNACMAYAAARSLGLTVTEIAAGLRSFPGLAHRMQEIGRLKGIPFINDSKATNADAVAKALSSFDCIYWIAGGIAKAGGITPLEQYFPKIAGAYLIGAASEEFARTIGKAARIEKCGTLDRAVASAARDATAEARPGAAVLLSPACASFDQYPNFEMRGEAFRAACAALPGISMTKGT